MFNFLIKKLNLVKKYRNYKPEYKRPFWFLYFHYQILQIVCFMIIDLGIIYVLKPTLDLISMTILYGLPALALVFFQTTFFKTFQLKLKCSFDFFSKIFGRSVVVGVVFLISLGVGYSYYIIYGSLRILFMCLVLPIIITYSVLNLEWVREDQEKKLVTNRVDNFLTLEHVSKKMLKYPIIGYFFKYASLRLMFSGVLCQHFNLDYPEILVLIFPGLIWMLYNRVALVRYSNSKTALLAGEQLAGKIVNYQLIAGAIGGLVAGGAHAHEVMLREPEVRPFVGQAMTNWYRDMWGYLRIRTSSRFEWDFARRCAELQIQPKAKFFSFNPDATVSVKESISNMKKVGYGFNDQNQLISDIPETVKRRMIKHSGGLSINQIFANYPLDHPIYSRYRSLYRFHAERVFSMKSILGQDEAIESFVTHYNERQTSTSSSRSNDSSSNYNILTGERDVTQENGTDVVLQLARDVGRGYRRVTNPPRVRPVPRIRDYDIITGESV
jgi:hypothetical protein